MVMVKPVQGSDLKIDALPHSCGIGDTAVFFWFTDDEEGDSMRLPTAETLPFYTPRSGAAGDPTTAAIVHVNGSVHTGPIATLEAVCAAATGLYVFISVGVSVSIRIPVAITVAVSIRVTVTVRIAV